MRELSVCFINLPPPPRFQRVFWNSCCIYPWSITTWVCDPCCQVDMCCSQKATCLLFLHKVLMRCYGPVFLNVNWASALQDSACWSQSPVRGQVGMKAKVWTADFFWQAVCMDGVKNVKWYIFYGLHHFYKSIRRNLRGCVNCWRKKTLTFLATSWS